MPEIFKLISVLKQGKRQTIFVKIMYFWQYIYRLQNKLMMHINIELEIKEPRFIMADQQFFVEDKTEFK